MLAVELVGKYEDGFLPNEGGWMDQDTLFSDLIGLGLAEKRTREKIEEQKRMNKAKLKGGRR